MRHAIMKTITPLALLLVTCVALATDKDSPSAGGGLYVFAAENERGEAGTPPFTVIVREVQRDRESSILQVESTSRNDGKSSVFMLKGMCGLMRARGQKGAVSEQISVQPLQFRMTFPESPKIDDRPGPPRLVFTERECAAVWR